MLQCVVLCCSRVFSPHAHSWCCARSTRMPTHCNPLQHTAIHCNTHSPHTYTWCCICSTKGATRALQCVVVCYSVLQCVAVCRRVSPCVAVRCSVLQWRMLTCKFCCCTCAARVSTAPYITPARTHTHTYLRVYIYIYIYMYIYIYTYIYIYIYTHKYIYVHIYIYITPAAEAGSNSKPCNKALSDVW